MYKSLAELIEAIRTGKVKSVTAWLDNDNVSFDDPSGKTLYGDKMPDEVLHEALDLLGIKHENV